MTDKIMLGNCGWEIEKANSTFWLLDSSENVICELVGMTTNNAQAFAAAVRPMDGMREALEQALDRMKAVKRYRDENPQVRICQVDAAIKQAESALAQAPVAPRDGWRDISTAPKDGTHNLYWYPKGEHVIGMAMSDGSVSAIGYFGDDKPTDWQPLPAAPAHDGRGSDDVKR